MRPVLLDVLREGYSRQQATADLIAGVIVGVVALPLAIAFAIASGLPPQYGLYTAIVAGFLGSLLGGSRVQISGPTGAFVVIVYGIVQAHGVPGLTLATIMAGLILVGFGVARLGRVIQFIPFPVTIGFTSGIAVVILSGQLRDILGLEMESLPADFVERWAAYGEALGTANLQALALGIGGIAVLKLWPRVSRRIPSPFVALALGTAAVPLLGLEVETVGSRFGGVSLGLPTLVVPEFSLDTVRALVPAAVAIAILGGVESLLSAVVADGMTGQRHDSNQELVGQGVANIVAPLLGGMPATGAIARTATNVRNGGRSPVSGIVHALTVLLICLFAAPLVASIPMAILASILVMVAWHMGEWGTFLGEFRGPRSDLIVLLTTFTLTVLVDLVVAIEVGMVLAAFLFMRRMAEVTDVSATTGSVQEPSEEGRAEAPLPLPPGVVVYEINGPFFFGAAEKFRDTLGTVATRPRALVLRMRNVPAMDSTGLNALRELSRRARKDGIHVVLSGVRPQPRQVLERSGLLAELASDNVLPSIEAALARVETLLTPGVTDERGDAAR
jgi:sulfate permease, SulP family